MPGGESVYGPFDPPSDGRSDRLACPYLHLYQDKKNLTVSKSLKSNVQHLLDLSTP